MLLCAFSVDIFCILLRDGQGMPQKDTREAQENKLLCLQDLETGSMAKCCRKVAKIRLVRNQAALGELENSGILHWRSHRS